MRVFSTHPTPVIATNSMDRTLSFLSATVVLLSSGCVVLLAVWLFNIEPRLPKRFAGGEMGIEVFAGTPSPRPAQVVASPEDVTDDPSARVAASDWVEVAELVEQISVMDADLIDEPPGGTAGRGTVEDSSRAIVVPRQTSHPERWVFVIDGIRSLEEYARLLQQFGIEVGAFDTTNRFAYLEHVTRARPDFRHATDARDERFFTSWKTGSLVDFDAQLFRNAGLESRDNQFVHFFPEQLERALRTQELRATYAAGKRSRDIRRTWFAVERSGQRFRFRVVRQQWR